jgi:hypothetical protein
MGTSDSSTIAGAPTTKEPDATEYVHANRRRLGNAFDERRIAIADSGPHRRTQSAQIRWTS